MPCKCKTYMKASVLSFRLRPGKPRFKSTLFHGGPLGDLGTVKHIQPKLLQMLVVRMKCRKGELCKLIGHLM